MHVFALLAEPVRRRLVEILASGEHTVAELADLVTVEFGVTRQAASYHLRILRDDRFVLARYEGGSRMYRLHPEALDRIDREIDHFRERWDQRYGWPYLVAPAIYVRPHRPGRAGLRGRGRGPGRRSEDDVWTLPTGGTEPWTLDETEDEGDGDHRWISEGGRPRPSL